MTNSILHDAEERAEDGPLGRFLAPITDNWWLLLVTGVAWLLVSIVVFRFDYSTVAAVSVLFGIVALAAAANEVLLATISSTGWRIAYLLMAALSFVIGIVSFVHPGDTFVALAALVSFYLVFRGSFDLIKAFSLSSRLPAWWVLVIAAVAELLLGFWAAGSWNNSMVVLVAWIGAAALTRGITEIIGAFQLRGVGRTATR